MSARRVIEGWWAETRATLALALPIMAGMISQMLMGVADTMMVSRVGTVPLAAASLGHQLSHLPLVSGLGLITGISVFTSHAYGAGRREDAGHVLRAGVWFSLAVGAASALVLALTRNHLGLLGQAPEVVREASAYILLTALSVVPVMLSYGIKQFSEALARPWKPMFIFTAGVLLNILLNWVFIFGHWGAPEMGVTGAGLATLLARIAIAVGMIVLLFADRALSEWAADWWRGLPSREETWKLVRFGGPVGALHLLEVGAFAFSGLMLGWIGAEALAAHQIAIVCAATTFTFALGLAMAVGIRVGHAWGRGDVPALRRTGFSAMASTALVMGGFAVVFLTMRHGIIGVFAPDPPVAALAASLLAVAAMFQLFDGQQVVSIFALRGIGDVRVPAWGAVLAYWLLALPVGYVLAFPVDLGAPGMWMGLALGLGVLAVGLGMRFVVLTRKAAPPVQAG